MNKLGRGMIGFIVAALAIPLPALTDFASKAPLIRSQVLAPPAEAPLVTLDLTDSGLVRQEYVLRRTDYSGGYRVEADNSTLSIRRVFRSDGRLVSLVESDARNGTIVRQTVTEDRRQVRTQKLENGRVISDKTAALSADLVLPSELDTVLAQAWATGIRDGLRLKSLSPDGSAIGDFQILFVETRQPLTVSAKYSYPDELRRALPPEPYVVADMSLTGFGALFFPHHYYLVFRKTAVGLQFVAYFGENPLTARFQFTPR